MTRAHDPICNGARAAQARLGEAKEALRAAHQCAADAGTDTNGAALRRLRRYAGYADALRQALDDLAPPTSPQVEDHQ